MHLPSQLCRWWTCKHAKRANVNLKAQNKHLCSPSHLHIFTPFWGRMSSYDKSITKAVIPFFSFSIALEESVSVFKEQVSQPLKVSLGCREVFVMHTQVELDREQDRSLPRNFKHHTPSLNTAHGTESENYIGCLVTGRVELLKLHRSCSFQKMRKWLWVYTLRVFTYLSNGSHYPLSSLGP